MKRSALIVKLAAIGDIVMALPMVKTLRDQNPGLKITWLCGKTAAPLLEKLNLVDEIITLDEKKLLTGSLAGRLMELFKVWLKLFGRRFDLIATGHADGRYALLSLTALAKKRTRFKRSGRHLLPLPGRHHSDEYVRLIGEDNIPVFPQALLPVVDWELTNELQEQIPRDKTTALVAFAPGGAKNVLHDDALRRWPLHHYVSLAEKLIENGYEVVLTGAPDDDWIIPSFAALNVIDLVGKTNLVELVALYGKCRVVVTHDSGPMHLAGLAGTSMVALFGPTNPFEKAPRSSKVRVLWGGDKLACRPCYDGKNYAACQNNVCLRQVSVDEVFNAVTGLINSASSNKNAETMTHQC